MALIFMVIGLVVLSACEGRQYSISKRSIGPASHFDIHVVEKNTSFVQEVDINLAKNLEIVNVPHHNNVNAMREMNDFKTGYSAMCLTEQNQCYVVRLDMSLYPKPGDLERALVTLWEENGDHASDQDETVVARKWFVKDLPASDLAALSDDMLDFIGDTPVFGLGQLPSDAIILENALEWPMRSKRASDFQPDPLPGVHPNDIPNDIPDESPDDNRVDNPDDYPSDYPSDYPNDDNLDGNSDGNPDESSDDSAATGPSDGNPDDNPDESSDDSATTGPVVHKKKKPGVRTMLCNGKMPVVKYAYNPRACDRMVFCTVEQCKMQHVTNVLFYECLCCPSTTDANKCLKCKKWDPWSFT